MSHRPRVPRKTLAARRPRSATLINAKAARKSPNPIFDPALEPHSAPTASSSSARPAREPAIAEADEESDGWADSDDSSDYTSSEEKPPMLDADIPIATLRDHRALSGSTGGRPAAAVLRDLKRIAREIGCSLEPAPPPRGKYGAQYFLHADPATPRAAAPDKRAVMCGWTCPALFRPDYGREGKGKGMGCALAQAELALPNAGLLNLHLSQDHKGLETHWDLSNDEFPVLSLYLRDEGPEEDAEEEEDYGIECITHYFDAASISTARNFVKKEEELEAKVPEAEAEDQDVAMSADDDKREAAAKPEPFSVIPAPMRPPAAPSSSSVKYSSSSPAPPDVKDKARAPSPAPAAAKYASPTPQARAPSPLSQPDVKTKLSPSSSPAPIDIKRDPRASGSATPAPAISLKVKRERLSSPTPAPLVPLAIKDEQRLASTAPPESEADVERLLSPSLTPAPLPVPVRPSLDAPFLQPPYFLTPVPTEDGGFISYSCRPGGARLYDHLQVLSTKAYGLMRWRVLEAEAVLLEDARVPEAQKCVYALHNRWVFLHELEMQLSPGACTARMVRTWWVHIYNMVGSLTLKRYLIERVRNRKLAAPELGRICAEYARLVEDGTDPVTGAVLTK